MRRARPALAVLIVLLALPGPSGSAADESGRSVWTDFEGRDLEGRAWTKETLEGKVVLLDFWATWCAPCLAALPTLREATDRFGSEGFLVLGVSMNRTDHRELRSFLRRQQIGWPQLHDGRGVAGPIAERFGVSTVPRTFLVDRSGQIVGVDLEGEVLLAALSALVARPPTAATCCVGTPEKGGAIRIVAPSCSRISNRSRASRW